MRLITQCSADKWSGRVEYAGDPDGRLVEIHTWPPWARRLTVALARLVTLHWLRVLIYNLQWRR